MGVGGDKDSQDLEIDQVSCGEMVSGLRDGGPWCLYRLFSRRKTNRLSSATASNSPSQTNRIKHDLLVS